MINLQQLIDRYTEYDNDIIIGYSINDKNSMKIYFKNNIGYSVPYTITERHYYKTSDDSVRFEVSHRTDDFEDLLVNTKVDLKKYYLHPWYPNKMIDSFELVKDIPFGKKGDIFKNIEGLIYIKLNMYTMEECLNYPEFFKPIYI